ncbi:3'(2'),5'-bisphosphate nucleotidase CysQ [Pseudaeromonas paramecii]|uniref:3'(2'),5'-bisphosphate nucleotidase CysQ n=1 Tax=Pseudaeromonas paramecii TaxID=2138166 RepID=A0ABP8Q429_9GAMM
MQLEKSLIESVIRLAEEAGRAILAVYDGPIDVTVKQDDSPLTQADKAAHRVIVDALAQLTPELPVLSEESDEAQKLARLGWSRYWLVDPLDGTKEFIRRNGEFTVNIALIEEGVSTFGVVHLPVQQLSYWGGQAYGAFKRSHAGETAIAVRHPQPAEVLKVIGSRSHLSVETQDYLAALGDHELLSVGSSLKFCRVAEGEAHLYPRLGPTCEWDTAAAQAVLEGAGGEVVTLEGEPLRYSKAELLNPWFIARPKG